MRSQAFFTAGFVVVFLLSCTLTLEDQMKVTTEELLLCFRKNESVFLSAKQILVVFRQHDNVINNPVPTTGMLSCDLQTSGQNGTAMSVFVKTHTCTMPHNTVSVSDGVSQELWTGCEEFFFPGRDFTSRSNNVTVTITLHNRSVPFSLTMIIRDVGPHKPDQLELRYVTKTLGYVQTPGWDPTQQVFYPLGMDSRVVIPIPRNHAALVTILHLDVKQHIDTNPTVRHFFLTTDLSCLDKLWVSKTTQVEKHVQEKCGVLRDMVPAVMFAKAFVVHFTSYTLVDLISIYHFAKTGFKRKDLERRHTGFRLIFTFHQKSSILPPPLPGKTLQCSFPSWRDFAPHYSCNLQVDCEEAEDEIGCSQQCGVGGFAVGNSCYYLARGSRTYTGNTAQTECRLSGGRLASFNTRQEWDQVTQELRRSAVPYYYHGLRVPLQSWPV